MLGVVTAVAQRSNSYKNVEDLLVGYSVGAHLGSQGFGVNAGYGLSNVFALRLAGSVAPRGFSKISSWGNHDFDMDMKGQYYNASLTLEVKPFRRAGNTGFIRKLAIVGGAAYFFKAEAEAVALPQRDYHYGDIVIPKEDLGKVNVHIGWKPWAPYLGVGYRNVDLGSSFKGGHLELNFDIGAYYMSSPIVQAEADKLMSGNTANAWIIARNMMNYRWLPVVQIGIGYRFVQY